MASILTLSTPIKYPGHTLDQIVNVSRKVGPHHDCANDAKDVLVVQTLIKLAAGAYSRNHGFPLPIPTGRLDTTTAFYIFEIQWRLKQTVPQTVVDGCVSPASGISYGGDSTFTIVQLNGAAQNLNAAAWKQLVAQIKTMQP